MNNQTMRIRTNTRQRNIKWLSTTVRYGILVTIAITISGCSLLSTGNQNQMETSVAETVAAQAPSATAESAASPTLPPSSTLPPTEVIAATDTQQPSLQPTLTPIPFTPVFPTLGPTSSISGCCNLRVRNTNRSTTLWIGTTLPYGGAFIQPLYYVEFYPARETWMTIYWCRRIDHNSWTDDSIDDFYDHWKNEFRYYCQKREVYVDEPMKEISVQ